MLGRNWARRGFRAGGRSPQEKVEDREGVGWKGNHEWNEGNEWKQRNQGELRLLRSIRGSKPALRSSNTEKVGAFVETGVGDQLADRLAGGFAAGGGEHHGAAGELVGAVGGEDG